MDEKERQLRLEEMRRQKKRQVRRRRMQRMILKRCLLVAVCVAVVLGCISGIWALVKPDNKKGEQESQKSVMEVEAGTEQKGTEDQKAEQQAKQSDAEVISPQEVGAPSSENQAAIKAVAEGGTQAQLVGLAGSTEVKYAVPGWQVDDNGWWYATDDRQYYVNGWKEVDGQYYYFNGGGYMQTGWGVVDGKSCYFDENGIYDPNKESKMIAMTFDDGPGEYTAELLDILEANGAKATFFMLGENVDDYGAEVIPRMMELGCELGNHSYDHPNLRHLDSESIRAEFDRSDQAIAQYSGGAVATVARTPYGSQDEMVTNAIGKPCIFWSLDTLDWDTKNVQSNIDAVVGKVKDGEIVLMHDIWPTTVESCKTIIPALIEEGYELVTVSELAQAKGINMENGVTYYEFYPEESSADTQDSSLDSSEEGTQDGTSSEMSES